MGFKARYVQGTEREAGVAGVRVNKVLGIKNTIREIKEGDGGSEDELM